MRINGKEIAQKIIDELKKEKRPDKALAAVLVGDNSASKNFLRQKEKIAEELGLEFKLFQFSENIGEKALIEEISKLGADEKIGGIIVQLPLPENFNRDKIISAIDIKKDIDALNPENNLVLSPAVEVVKDILRIMNYELGIKIVVVVGAKGFLIGKPVSEYLRDKCKKLIELDLGDDLSRIKEADLIITGVGKAGLINPEMLKEETGVIDFGYDMKDGKLSGDFDTTDLKAKSYEALPAGRQVKASWYTPTPGGTGPILVAEVFRNFYKQFSGL